MIGEMSKVFGAPHGTNTTHRLKIYPARNSKGEGCGCIMQQRTPLQLFWKRPSKPCYGRTFMTVQALKSTHFKICGSSRKIAFMPSDHSQRVHRNISQSLLPQLPGFGVATCATQVTSLQPSGTPTTFGRPAF